MSIATKRKYVARELTNELVLPGATQFIAKVLSGRGNNLHEVSSAEGEIFLVSMPTKFRKTVWIKRGDFVLCDSIAEGDKVRGEIFRVLYKDQIRYIKQSGLWPSQFEVQMVADQLGNVGAELRSEDEAESSPEELSDEEEDADDECEESSSCSAAAAASKTAQKKMSSGSFKQAVGMGKTLATLDRSCQRSSDETESDEENFSDDISPAEAEKHTRRSAHGKKSTGASLRRTVVAPAPVQSAGGSKGSNSKAEGSQASRQ